MIAYPRDINPDILDPLLEPYKVGANDGVSAPEDSLGKRVAGFQKPVHKTDRPE